ncbi:hypothetical protein BMS3Abin07_00339 [bacterium BMS3Abin07]|nr:hypothetical protein BMS3Abin07_00339 [bacterium BMS3Abin07]GBE31253.1 hypothetical protein BMS3Bbin05_00152 [bacterium BMS3Bbin05]
MTGKDIIEMTVMNLKGRWRGLLQNILVLLQETRDYPSQQTRLILFLPDAETAMTTSIWLPQMRHVLTLFLDPALEATSVFDFFFSAIMKPPLYVLNG